MLLQNFVAETNFKVCSDDLAVTDNADWPVSNYVILAGKKTSKFILVTWVVNTCNLSVKLFHI